MRNGVLRENARMRFAVVVHDAALVVHDILNGHRRTDHLARRAEMIELTAWQRHHSHRQRLQFRVVNRRIGPQCTTEFRIQIVFAEIHAIGSPVARSAALLQQPHRLVAQHPDADIRQVEVVLQQLRQRLRRRLLQHLFQDVRRTAVAHEHPVVLGDRGVQPQTVTHHIGLRNLSDALGSTDIHVAADNHRRQTARRLFHHPLIQRQLQVHQRLRQPLTALPAEYGNRRQHLATDSIRRQPLALSSGMQNDATLALQPFFGLLQHPGSTSTRPQPMADRVTRAEVFVMRQTSHFMEAFHHIWGQRQ